MCGRKLMRKFCVCFIENRKRWEKSKLLFIALASSTLFCDHGYVSTLSVSNRPTTVSLNDALIYVLDNPIHLIMVINYTSNYFYIRCRQWIFDNITGDMRSRLPWVWRCYHCNFITTSNPPFFLQTAIIKQV